MKLGATLFGLALSSFIVAGCGSSGSGETAFSIKDAGTTTTGAGDATLPPTKTNDDGGMPTPVLVGEDGGPGLTQNEDGGFSSSCPEPITCLSQGFTCGSAGDGCGNTIQCGTCISPQTCGGGGSPSVCGDSTPCVPKTCANLGATCGQQGDGCGNIIQCGVCTLPQTCGGGGMANACGAAPSGPDSGPPVSCTPATCATANATCGQVADGCGGLTANCGNCVTPSICGGGGIPNQCGDSNEDGGTAGCTNLCLAIPTCAAGTTTSISGTVVAPTPPAYGTPDPLYGALVYIPNSPGGALDAFPNGVSCDQCGAEASGSPLVSMTTGPDGKFQLTGVPAGSSIPVVFQLGRWRREVFVNVNPCVDNPLTLDQSRMPRKQAEGTPYDNIPLTALVTGSIDALECVLRKIGIDDSQVGNPTSPAYGAGDPRLQLYVGDPSKDSEATGGASYNSSTPLEDKLWGSTTTLDQYDQVLLACQGGADTRSAAALANMQDYANVGGRVYATHYSYDWIFTNKPWSTTAGWTDPDTGNDPPTPVTSYVDMTFTKGVAFAQWLVYSGASATAGQVPIENSRHDFSTPLANGGQQWLYSKKPSSDTPLHYTFDTPVGVPAASQCGRVLYSDFHVNNADTDPSTDYPSECDSSPMTAQEKVLEFMIFDLASCIPGNPPPPPPPTCTPLTCGAQNIGCGPAGDGCGNVLQCGNCAPGMACGAGGPSMCGPVPNMCTPTTCATLGYGCGYAGDGCGNLLDCGMCALPQTCGGGGVANQCGSPPCTPAKCAASQNCGVIADGCGGSVSCGTCTPPETCGGGGVANQCGDQMAK
jgi:hypothetical protein